MNQSLEVNTPTSVLSQAETYKFTSPTTEQLATDANIESDKAETFGTIIKDSNFDDDIRAYALLDYLGVNEKTPEAEKKKVSEIYNWLKDGREDVFGLVEKVKKIELLVGNPLGQSKLDKVWYYLALDAQERSARIKKEKLLNA